MCTTHSFHLNAKLPRIGSSRTARAYANIATQTQPVVGPKVLQRVEPVRARMQKQPPNVGCDSCKVFKRGVVEKKASHRGRVMTMDGSTVVG